jgi:RHS repeat-associated protein
VTASLIGGLGIDDAIAKVSQLNGSPDIKTYLTDALGSAIALSKADQSTEVGYAYSPYGQTLKAGVESGPAAEHNSTQYTGRENDGAQGGTGGGELYYYRARYYDPVLKRFISQDPIGLAGGMNVYQYVEGNPLSMTDPEGLQGRGNVTPGGPGANLRWPSMGTNAPAPTYNVNQTSANRGNLSSTNANLMNFFTANSNGIYQSGSTASGGTMFTTVTPNGTRLTYRNDGNGARVDIYTRSGGRETLHPDGGACLR